MSVEWSGQEVTVEEVRERIGYRVADGRTDYDELVEAIESYGLHVSVLRVYFKNQLLDLIRSVDTLVIIKVSLEKLDYEENGGHYIIVYDYFADLIAAADPLKSPDIYYSTNKVWNAINDPRVIVVWKR